MKKTEKIAQGAAFAAVSVGKWDDLGQHVFELGPEMKIPGKVFVGQDLGATGAEISFETAPAGGGGAFIHTHRQNEEIYVVLSGQGQFQVDGQVFPIGEGGIVRVAPAGKRAWRNTGSQALVMACIQVKAGSMQELGVGDGVIEPDPVVW